MKRVLSCGAVALMITLVSSADAAAQGKMSGFLAAGPTQTSGDLKDAARKIDAATTQQLVGATGSLGKVVEERRSS